MQTIASLADRLDMSAEEAVETLRKLHFDVEGVESVIDDKMTDMLIDVDEDPSAIDRFLSDILKKEEADRKRTERLQQAAQKAAAKRKAEAQKKAEAKKKADEKKKAEAEKKAEAKKKAAPKKKDAAKKDEAEEKVIEEEEEEAAPEETMPGEAPSAPDEPDTVAAEVESPAETIAPEAERPKVKAEILRDEPKTPAKKTAPAIIIGAAADTAEEAIEIVRADGTHAKATDIEDVGPPLDFDMGTEPGTLADAERRQEEEERRRARQRASSRPLPTPDPEVVAEVIRKAHERSAKQKTTRAARVTQIDTEQLFTGAPKKTGHSGKTARKRQKRAERARVLEDTLRRDAAAAVREYQAGTAGAGIRKRRKKKIREDSLDILESQGGVIEVAESMTVEQLAEAMDMPVSDIILELMDENILVNKNQTLELDLIRRIADRHDFEVETIIPEEEEILSEIPDKQEDLQLRAPVVTVMGHVDHGKTSLLDIIRKANVAAGEEGGITQHIAAYDVETSAGRVVFLDTPGHEAFTQMRARGAKVTDLVVLVVAADDGVRPQTIEAIDHAKAAEVPIVVAINKCDKPEAQPDRVRQELTQYELVDEAWGGKTIMRNISAKTGEGVSDLLDLLVLQAQMLELKANPDKHARGTIIESEISQGLGPVAWVLLQSGTLRTGDVFLVGETYGRVRTLVTARGDHIEAAGPSTPVVVTGFNAPPDAGDLFVVTDEERVARAISEKRAALNRQKRGPAVKRMTLEDFHERMMGGEQKTLNIILKADVQGSVDVLRTSFAKLGNQEVGVEIVHAGVGGVNESDVMLANASDAVIIGFHVSANPRVQKLAEQEGVDIRSYRVIYEAIEEVRKSLEGMLAPEAREVVMGHAEVRQIFRSSAIGNIAGCSQLDGETLRGSRARILRDDVIIYEGRIATLRRGKDDVRSVATGFECGIKLERFDDVQVGDIIETFRIEEVAKTLN